MAKIIFDDDAAILAAVNTLPNNWRGPEWVKLMVGAWNEATKKMIARTGCGLTVNDQHEIANALLLADKRSCCGERRMGGRESRVERIHMQLALANESLWKLDFSGFHLRCEWIEGKYRKSTVYETLRKL